MNERLSGPGKLQRVGDAISRILGNRRKKLPQFAEDDWRSKLDPATQYNYYFKDGVGMWPIGPGNMPEDGVI